MDGNVTHRKRLQELPPRRRKDKKRSLSPDDKENAALEERNVISGSIHSLKKKKKKKTKKTNGKDPKKEKKAKKSSKQNESKKCKRIVEDTTGTLTGNAVESLVSFARYVGKDKPSLPDQIVVRLHLDRSLMAISEFGERHFQDQTLLATIDDGDYTLPVLLMDDSRNQALQKHLREISEQGLPASTSVPCILVVIRGLIATDGHNPKYDLDPIICLTKVEVLLQSRIQATAMAGKAFRLAVSSSPPLSQSPPPSPNQQKAAPSSLSTVSVRAGTIGTFLDQTLPFSTTEEFVRCHDTVAQKLILSEPFATAAGNVESSSRSQAVEASLDTMNQHAEQVQAFAARHSAMMTLQAASQPTEQAVQNYTNALREFASSQLDRQKASLATNAGREAAGRANLITSQYKAALEQAMEPTDESYLTSERLLQWHKTLLKDLHPDAGQIRTKTVRAGHTVFCRPKEIANEMDKFCLALAHLQERLQLGKSSSTASSPSNSTATTPDAWHAILFAAIAMYGIVDIHPFADGNGRMSRIVANWALRSFPFTINIFATPAQRAEYILALESTRHLLTMSSTKKVYGTVSSDERLAVVKSIGIFAPLVRLLMDRMGRAVVEFHRVWEEKWGLVAEALESKAARLARERAKEGTCLVCLDENPNIATLCCGKAVHLNCIAEWLSGKNSCPNCRSEMPSISGRVVRAARNGDTEGRARRRDDNAVSPSSRRFHRRFFQNAQDVIVSLLSNYDEDQDTTMETAEGEAYESANDTTMGGTDDSEDSDMSSFSSDEEEEESEYSEEDSEDNDDSREEEEDADDDPSDESADDDAYFNDETRILVGRGRYQHAADSYTDSILEELFGDEDPGDGSTSDVTSAPASSNGEGNANRLEPATHAHDFCDALYCRNRPAIDCSNNLCGRCCVLGGEFHCPRHNS